MRALERAGRMCSGQRLKRVDWRNEGRKRGREAGKRRKRRRGLTREFKDRV